MNVAAWVIRAIDLRGQERRQCPHCRAGDPFFDATRVDHVIHTEAGIGTERCWAVDGEGEPQ